MIDELIELMIGDEAELPITPMLLLRPPGIPVREFPGIPGNPPRQKFRVGIPGNY